MAVLASSQVTRVATWTEGGTNGRRRKCWRAQIATSNDGTGQGSATNYIPASVFEMSIIEECSVATKNDDDIILAAPSYDGTKLLLYNLLNATDANRGDPADFINTTFAITVKGY